MHCVDRDDFYEVSFDDLEDGEYKGWICTRQVFDYRVYERRDFKIFFSRTATEIARAAYHKDELSLEERVMAMHKYAFMNYFKRPSYDAGETIMGLSDDDYRYAYDVSKVIIELLQ